MRQCPAETRKIIHANSVGFTAIQTLLLALLILLLAGCAAGGDVRKPIPSEFVAAGETAHRLVIVLPGRGDDLSSLQEKGVAGVIQNAWPDADVMLTGLTMPFYRQGRASSRLRDEIIVPARIRGDREVWLLGISLGGMGALLYEHEYPGEIRGLLLFSPYLGDEKIQQEIIASGGLGKWSPGSKQALSSDTFQHELWHTLKKLSSDPQRSTDLWIAYGEDEPFRKPIEMISPPLAESHRLMMPGKHNWSLWIPAIERLLNMAGDNASLN